MARTLAPEQLRDLLAARGMKQKELADSLGVEPSTVSRWVTGQTSPSPAQIKEIARHLDSTSAELTRDSASHIRVAAPLHLASMPVFELATAGRPYYRSQLDLVTRRRMLWSSDVLRLVTENKADIGLAFREVARSRPSVVPVALVSTCEHPVRLLGKAEFLDRFRKARQRRVAFPAGVRFFHGSNGLGLHYLTGALIGSKGPRALSITDVDAIKRSTSCPWEHGRATVSEVREWIEKLDFALVAEPLATVLSQLSGGVLLDAYDYVAGDYTTADGLDRLRNLPEIATLAQLQATLARRPYRLTAFAREDLPLSRLRAFLGDLQAVCTWWRKLEKDPRKLYGTATSTVALEWLDEAFEGITDEIRQKVAGRCLELSSQTAMKFEVLLYPEVFKLDVRRSVGW